VSAIPNVESNRKRIAIVGTCASGKSTLASRLREAGYDAFVSGQEHSDIVDLWKHLNPDIVIALEIDLETVRARRGSSWSESLYNKQRERLERAREAAIVVIDTGKSDEEATVRLARRAIEHQAGGS
jgi:adenylate kinase family enzyme